MLLDLHRPVFVNGLAFSLAIVVSVLAGLSLVTRPAAVGAFVAGVAGIGLAASSFRKPLAALVLVSALGIAATVDMLGRLMLGPTSLYAWVTAALTGLLLVVASTGAAALSHTASRTVLMVALFPVYALLSIFWYQPTLAAVQNVFIYLAFALVLLVAARAASSGALGFDQLRTALFWTYSIAAGLYLASVALDGLGGGAVIGNRSYGLFAVTGVAWTSALARYGYRREGALVALSLFLVLLSLSRLAFAAGLLLVLLASLDFRTPGRMNRTAILVTLVVVLGYSSVVWFSPFAQRFQTGDVVSFAHGISVNVEGRTDLWAITWHSAIASPWFGGGAGSSEAAISASLGTPNHPHNDYLRLFHDFGAAGLLLFLTGVFALFRLTWNRLRATRLLSRRALHLAALLELVALCLVMTTDNAIVYLFFVVPVGIVVGMSAGIPMPDEGGRQ